MPAHYHAGDSSPCCKDHPTPSDSASEAQAREIKKSLIKMLRERSGTTCSHCDRRYDDSTCNSCFAQKIFDLIAAALAAKDGLAEAHLKRAGELAGELRDALEAVHTLNAEIERLRSYCLVTFGDSHPEIKKCPHELQVEALRAALERYGQHRTGCVRNTGHLTAKCNCGLDAALTSTPPGAEGEPELCKHDADRYCDLCRGEAMKADRRRLEREVIEAARRLDEFPNQTHDHSELRDALAALDGKAGHGLQG